jgi:hypothetical protein
VVTNYFRSKQDLDLETYQPWHHVRARVEQAIAAAGTDPLAACLRTLLPLDDKSLVGWKVWLDLELERLRAGSGNYARHQPRLVDSDSGVRFSLLPSCGDLTGTLMIFGSSDMRIP